MTANARSPCVLWWGRFDAAYSRNAVMRSAFEALGWRSEVFRPVVSRFGDTHALLRRPSAADLIWVPCFRQRDVAAARRFATARGVPLVVDPLISAYDKQVGERAKFAPDSRQARRLLAWERDRLAAADRVVADTEGHLAYFRETLGVAPGALHVVPVGAEEHLFRPRPLPGANGPFEALFYGSFLPLQGAHIIVEAARHLATPGLRVTMLGEGPEQARCAMLAAGQDRVRFEPWIAYDELPARIHRAHLLLGVFGDTPKSARVIPNKVYQALASARPVVTRESDAYPGELVRAPSSGLRFVTPADALALAGVIDGYFGAPASMEAAAHDARRVYERWFSAARVQAALARLLASLDLPCRAPGG